ncbi:hypothetical protein C7450_103241 [Chelatococcus asaccharovorans]|uniref:Uncharacterized protein n=1 Tax=Chelatococcus asaccharovorans TaxID=28210 RepID=A0A2V3UB27_9HYPH|nr:hypothetical protein C7450_103241 [Chelatococcus asaccharovorans]
MIPVEFSNLTCDHAIDIERVPPIKFNQIEHVRKRQSSTNPRHAAMSVRFITGFI